MKKKDPKVTRIAHSKSLPLCDFARLGEIAKRLGVLRSNVWHEFGALKGVGIADRDIRDQWVAEKREFDVPARLWKETLRDVFSDIVAYREAAKVLVRKAIRNRVPGETLEDENERIRLYTLLKYDEWLSDSFLHRKMRQHCKHGKTKVRNQIVLDKQCYKVSEVDGKAQLEVMSLVRGKRIKIPLNTSQAPSGTLRLILKNQEVEIHYSVNPKEVCSTRPCGTKTLGVDKGYTEVFTDSEDRKYGEGLGKLLSAESDFLKLKYQRRNKLKAVAEAKPHKSQKIERNNLGRKKLDGRKRKHTENVRDVVFKATHALIDEAGTIASEDLTARIKSKKPRSRDMKRRLGGWVKGLIAVALQMVSERRGAALHLVNASYTSQGDSRFNGVLLGERRGDRFYCFDGVVLDSDGNAARNIKARMKDSEILLWMPYRKVREILLERTEQFKRMGLLIQDSSCVPF